MTEANISTREVYSFGEPDPRLLGRTALVLEESESQKEPVFSGELLSELPSRRQAVEWVGEDGIKTIARRRFAKREHSCTHCRDDISTDDSNIEVIVIDPEKAIYHQHFIDGHFDIKGAFEGATKFYTRPAKTTDIKYIKSSWQVAKRNAANSQQKVRRGVSRLGTKTIS